MEQSILIDRNLKGARRIYQVGIKDTFHISVMFNCELS